MLNNINGFTGMRQTSSFTGVSIWFLSKKTDHCITSTYSINYQSFNFSDFSPATSAARVHLGKASCHSLEHSQAGLIRIWMNRAVI